MDLTTDYADNTDTIVTINDIVKFYREKIRRVIPNYLLKICEIDGICGFNLRIWVKSKRRSLNAFAANPTRQPRIGVKISAKQAKRPPFAHFKGANRDGSHRFLLNDIESIRFL
jgi:hypothetical protein